MGKLAKLQTVATGFVQALPKATLTAQDPRRSKAIGSPTPIHQTTCQGANGSAEEVNQCDNSMKKMKSCGGSRDMDGKGKKYLEVEIKMGKMPKRAAKKAPKRK
jgi:hypothetical protein